MIVRIYPTQDTYITNESDLLTNNFGIDEILELSKTSKTPLYQGEIDSKILIASLSLSFLPFVILFSLFSIIIAVF